MYKSLQVLFHTFLSPLLAPFSSSCLSRGTPHLPTDEARSSKEALVSLASRLEPGQHHLGNCVVGKKANDYNGRFVAAYMSLGINKGEVQKEILGYHHHGRFQPCDRPRPSNIPMRSSLTALPAVYPCDPHYEYGYMILVYCRRLSYIRLGSRIQLRLQCT